MTIRGYWILASGIAAMAGCERPPAPPTAAGTASAELPTVTVTLAPLQTRSVPRTVTAVGTLYGFDEVTLAPKVEGRVRTVAADVGDPALPGGVLLELDPTDYHLAVEEARRGLDAELAKLGLTELADGPVGVDDVPAVRKADVALLGSRTRFNRVKELFDRSSASKDEFDAADTDLKLADATKRDVVAQARATVATARLKRAALDTARQRLDDCKLLVPTPPGWEAWAAAVGPGFSPLRYSVAQRMLSDGEMVRSMPVTNAFRLVIAHALKLRAAVPERFSAEVRVGQPVELRVDAFPDTVFRGVVARVNPTVDPQNRTFQVETAVPNLDGRLKVGGFARAAILVRTDPAVRAVPPQAVVSFAGVNKVFVAEGGKAWPVEVRIGDREKDWVEVIGPFPAAAEVVTSGQTQLVDGSPLRVR